MRHRIPFPVRPMLAMLVAEPFDRPGWVYEEKYDGDRMLAYKEGTRVQLYSRNAKDNTVKRRLTDGSVEVLLARVPDHVAHRAAHGTSHPLHHRRHSLVHAFG